MFLYSLILLEEYQKQDFTPIKHSVQQGIAVSVVITTKNHEKSIEQCLRSVLAQTLENIQVYIIDESSTDGTKKTIQNYLQKYNVKFITVENKGQLFAQIRGIREASGKYITFIDGGDEFSSIDVLKKAYEKARLAKIDTLHFGIQQIQMDQASVDEKLNPETTELKAEDWVKGNLAKYEQIYGKLINLHLIKGISRVNTTFEGITKYSGLILLNLMQLTTKSYVGADFIGYNQKLDNARELSQFAEFKDGVTAAAQLNEQFQAQMPAITLLREHLENMRPIAKQYGYDFCQLYDAQFGFTKYQKGAFGYPEFLFCDEPKKFTVVYMVKEDDGHVQEKIDFLLHKQTLNKQFYELAIAINDDLVHLVSNETRKTRTVRVVPIQKGASHIRGGSQVAVGAQTLFLDSQDNVSADFMQFLYLKADSSVLQQFLEDEKSEKGKLFPTKQLRFITQNIREDLGDFAGWAVNLMFMKHQISKQKLEVGEELVSLKKVEFDVDEQKLVKLVKALNLAATKCPAEKMEEVYGEVKKYFGKVDEEICKVRGQAQLGIEAECQKYKVV